MPYHLFDRGQVRMKPLANRQSKLSVEHDFVDPESSVELPAPLAQKLEATVETIVRARKQKRPVVLAFGAHTIKNGLSPVLIELIRNEWITHLATNGAGVIHDWEFAFQGRSTEDVAHYTSRGEFGNWQETGWNINLAINVGAASGLGYGEAVGRFILEDGVDIPTPDDLRRTIETAESADGIAMAAELLSVLQRHPISPGRYTLQHPWKKTSLSAQAARLGIPFTSHPMFGHDIIYNHAMNNGPLLGRAAERDFLAFAHSISLLHGGVYLSVGSAIMSPMIFEKSLSIARNVAHQRGERIDEFTIYVVDLAESRWDWSEGEPPMDNPDYYLRYNKTFSRMGGELHYIQSDNRDFLMGLNQLLQE